MWLLVDGKIWGEVLNAPVDGPRMGKVLDVNVLCSTFSYLLMHL